jgi:predicted regulator of amino acid metabolism with ACT domain
MDLLITGDVAILNVLTEVSRKLGCKVIVIKGKEERTMEILVDIASQLPKMEFEVPKEYEPVREIKTNEFIENKMKWKKARWER